MLEVFRYMEVCEVHKVTIKREEKTRCYIGLVSWIMYSSTVRHISILFYFILLLFFCLLITSSKLALYTKKKFDDLFFVH